MQELLRAALDEGAVGLLLQPARDARRPTRQPRAVEPGFGRRAGRAGVGVRRPRPRRHRVHQPQQPRGPRRRRPRAHARDVRGVGQADERQPHREPADAGRRVEARVGVRRRGARRRAPGAPAVAAAADAGVLRPPRHLPLRRDGGVPRGAHRRRPPGGAAARSRGARPHAACLRAHRGARAGLHLGRGEGRARRRPSRVAGAHRRRSRARVGRRSVRRVPRRVARRRAADDVHARADRSAPRPDGRPRRSSVTRRASRGAATPARTSPATAASTSRPGCSASTCPTWCRWRKRCAALPPSPPSCTASPTAGGWAPARAPISWCGTRSRSGIGATRWSEDFPAGGGRFVVDATGYRALVVNGEVVRRDGADTGARPGRVLRPGTVADV